MNILSALPVVCLIIALPYCEPVDGVILLHCRRKDGKQDLECDIRGVTIRKPNKYEFKVACPHHHAFDNVRQLSFQSSNVDYLPRGLFNTLRYIEKAELKNVQLEYIHPEAFHYAKYLKYLDLSHNRLTHIGDELTGAGNLVYLDVSHNQISNIHPSTFQRLGNLKILILESNLLTQFNAIDRSFHELDLQQNYLTLVCANATILNLNSNRIKAFSTCKSIVHELKLSNNLLSSFNVIQLTNLQGLKNLDLSRNSLREIYFDQLPHTLHLQRLNLSQCGLMQLTLNNLYDLRTIDLSYNPKIDPTILKPLKHLEELHVKGMKFTVDDFAVIRDEMKKLKRIHILSDWTCEYLEQIVDVFCKTSVVVNFGKSCTEDVVIRIDADDGTRPVARARFAEGVWFYVMLIFGIILCGSLAYIVLKKYCLPRLPYYY